MHVTVQPRSPRQRPATPGCTDRTGPEAKADGALIDAVRDGNASAYAQLYKQHRASAYNLARQLCRDQADADDLVAEAFVAVLDMLLAKRGPDAKGFRAYLLTAMRHIAYDKTRRNRKIELARDVSKVKGVRVETVSVAFIDTAVAGLERRLAATAFSQLREQWQAVIWRTEIDGQSPADAGMDLGLTPNGVSARAYRARQGLRSAYLQAQLGESNVDRACGSTFGKLGAWIRNSLAPTHKADVDAHLKQCGQCRHRVRQLAESDPALVHRRCMATIGYRTANRTLGMRSSRASAGRDIHRGRP